MMERLLAKYIEIKNAEEGQTAVEYVLVLGLVIAMVAGVLFTSLGTGITNAISEVATDLTDAF